MECFHCALAHYTVKSHSKIFMTTVFNIFSTLGVITLINTDWIYNFKETFICPWKVLRISLHNISPRPVRSPRGSSFVQSNTQLVR